jgi:hypothetical protein
MLRLRSAVFAFAVLSFTACDDSNSPNNGGPDIIQGTDTATEDTSTGIDTSAPLDVETLADVAAADTTTPPLDTATEDTSTPADVTTPDVATPDVETPTDTGSADTAASAGACDNAGDLGRFEALDTTLQTAIGECVNQCLGTFTLTSACFGGCVEDKTGLSQACSGCFGDVMLCTVNNCALQCIDPASANCTQCRDANCTPSFIACAGVQQPGT